VIKLEKNEMGGEHSMSVGEEKRVRGFGGESRGRKATWKIYMYIGR
jgi:hypothetical protein